MSRLFNQRIGIFWDLKIVRSTWKRSNKLVVCFELLQLAEYRKSIYNIWKTYKREDRLGIEALQQVDLNIVMNVSLVEVNEVRMTLDEGVKVFFFESCPDIEHLLKFLDFSLHVRIEDSRVRNHYFDSLRLVYQDHEQIKSTFFLLFQFNSNGLLHVS